MGFKYTKKQTPKEMYVNLINYGNINLEKIIEVKDVTTIEIISKNDGVLTTKTNINGEDVIIKSRLIGIDEYDTNNGLYTFCNVIKNFNSKTIDPETGLIKNASKSSTLTQLGIWSAINSRLKYKDFIFLKNNGDKQASFLYNFNNDVDISYDSETKKITFLFDSLLLDDITLNTTVPEYNITTKNTSLFASSQYLSTSTIYFSFKNDDDLRSMLVKAIRLQNKTSKYPISVDDIISMERIDTATNKINLKVTFKSGFVIEFPINLILFSTINKKAEDPTLGWKKMQAMLNDDFELKSEHTDEEFLLCFLDTIPENTIHFFTDDNVSDAEMIANITKYLSYELDASKKTVEIIHKSIIFRDIVTKLNYTL